MDNKLLDILPHTETPIDDEMLAKYLSGVRDEEARHEVEKLLQQGGELEQEAWEGWHQTGSGPRVVEHARDLNRKLKQQLQPAGVRVRKKPIKNLPAVTWWVIGLVFLLLLVAWAIIWQMAT